MQTSTWDKFTNQYSLSKTLRFELKPVGKTLNFIEHNNLINEDEQREKDFNDVKKIMDEYYRYYIKKTLKNIKISTNNLEEYRELYNLLKKEKDENISKKLLTLQKDIRKEILKQFEKDEDYKAIFGKDLIIKILPEWLQAQGRDDDLTKVNLFARWTTYFIGYYENRKNIFSDEKKSTSLIFRIVNINLPKYLDNLARFEKISQINGFDYSGVEKDFSSHLNGRKLKDFFSVHGYNNCFDQDGIDLYNLVIGGYFKDNKKIKGFNETVNLFSQQQEKNEQKKIRKLKMIQLYKQILSESEEDKFNFNPFNSDSEVIGEINKFYTTFEPNLEKTKQLLLKIKEYDLNEIYIKNDRQITDISQQIFKDYNVINRCLKKYANDFLGLTEKKTQDWLKKKKFVSIANIQVGYDKLIEAKELDVQEYKPNIICDYFSNLKISDKDIITEVQNKYNELKSIKIDPNKPRLLQTKDSNEQVKQDVKKIKDFLDSTKDFLHFINPLYFEFAHSKGEKEEVSVAEEIDSDFYHEFEDIYKITKEIIPLYNKVRNYITQKPFSSAKFKLNFSNPTLLSGWDKNKIKDNYSVLLRKNGLYYLAIMTPYDNSLFESDNFNPNEDCYEMIDYKLLPGANKMMLKVFFSKKHIDFFNPSEKIIAIRNYSTHTKNGKPQDGYEKRDFDIKDCHNFINYLKDCLKKHKEWEIFNFNFKPTSEYKDYSEFCKDVEEQGYNLELNKISKSYIDDLVSEGKLYLFKIWNKDFSEYSKGKKNLHTIYWENLFSDYNFKNIIYKLNGKAEIFYRKKSLDKKITHEKNKYIENRNPINGKTKSLFKYDLIKDKRYTEDKFLFHCPITINFNARGNNKNLHKLVNKYIQETKDEINVLSIDRGERNLLYYTLVDSKGNILKQESLNCVSADINRRDNTSYITKLNDIKKQRDEARKNWNTIQNIKEMKEGYLSQIIHKVTKLAVENNAIIVLEDLNFGFKRGRFKIEKQVYQKFEKALIEKLNYLAFKEKKQDEIGSTMHGYQLANKFESFQKLGKQTGILYYVDARNTSKIDPSTGFVNLLWPNYESLEKSKKFLSKFDSIIYNSKENMFEFKFRYSKFKTKTEDKIKLLKDEWTIFSNGTRLISFRNKDKNSNWDIKEINLTDELKSLFDNNSIEYRNEENLVMSVVNNESVELHKKIMDILKATLQLRNSNKDTGEDYILSCVKNKEGKFFDSRNADPNMPLDADANGAYNIGIKGLMLIDGIKSSKKDKVDKIDRNDFINFVIGMRY